MAITDEIRKAFDECTVMAGVENDFECVYMTKGAALLYLDEIDAESDRMREQVDAAHMSRLLTENENEKLREQIHWLKQGDILHVLTDQEYIDQCERERLMQVSIDALDKENAKLRELAAGIGHLLFSLDVDYCAGCPRDDINHPCPVYTVKGGECLYETDLRKLGVEVDA